MSSTPSPSTQAQPADQRPRRFVWPLSLSVSDAVDDSWAPPSQQPKDYETENRAAATRPRRKFVWPLSLRVWNTVDGCWAAQETPSESSGDLGPTPRGLSRRLSIIIVDRVRVYVDYVLSIMWFVLAWANETRKAIVRRVFGLNPESAEETNTTSAEFVSKVKKAYQNTPIERFFKNNPKFIEELAGKAAALVNDPSTPICGENLLSKTVQVTMHQQVLYCDDSSSMHGENLWVFQSKLIKRIARVTTRILPEGEGVHMRYIGQKIPNPHSLKFEELVELVDMTQPLSLDSQTPIVTERLVGRNLESKVLEPLVYSKLPDNLLRPLLIFVFVNWMPERQTQLSTFVDVIVECGDKLEDAGLPRESVKFMIGQVGSATMVAKLMQDISMKPKIQNVVSVASENLEVASSRLWSDWEIDEWVINTLYEPIMKSEQQR